jgi:hypothetical protein
MKGYMDTAGYAVEAGPSKKMSCLPVTELVESACTGVASE